MLLVTTYSKGNIFGASSYLGKNTGGTSRMSEIILIALCYSGWKNIFFLDHFAVWPRLESSMFSFIGVLHFQNSQIYNVENFTMYLNKLPNKKLLVNRGFVLHEKPEDNFIIINITFQCLFKYISIWFLPLVTKCEVIYGYRYMLCSFSYYMWGYLSILACDLFLQLPNVRLFNCMSLRFVPSVTKCEVM